MVLFNQIIETLPNVSNLARTETYLRTFQNGNESEINFTDIEKYLEYDNFENFSQEPFKTGEYKNLKLQFI